ncbi:3-mercaptopyruvate sulfurtransferase [Pelagibacterium halotolerans]|uniref:Sulfurtransferase n=1 Tax=Pelagibacterium halotolerans (strain DSM 22347 / JCM 15775 / CGMCC 1.7692 / B2) TaxID=1082931 RepID=G4R7H6_PELHB|nr:3-mercaptopyruvate sulfurtransferase [Pelagibacterium halotolerans]AEQ52277.1 thiosulfate sulfurtransferase, rhodanese [Pelagibacterium halotolerans B2]QJR17974.1 3-mercaptopyruvate sulfurtransferase [Pelagibacterium halotolerans]SEA31888.1 thiosulfate/3-mercaptopyruvate sulfurtransferase [Pelagibacterium halotolerans]
MSHFVTTQWLADHLDDPDIQVIDASWHMPNSGRDAQAEYEAGHIPGAIFFDLDKNADTSSGLPHMLPDADTFSAMAGALGIASDKTLVVYDEAGLFSAPRAWWTFTVMGARVVKILEGGGPKWRAEDRPLESGESIAPRATFDAKFDNAAVAGFEQVLAASQAGQQILDARGAARFTGDTPEPRAGLKSGHIPQSRNLPFDALIENGTLKPDAELEKAIRAAGIDPAKPVITSCGSGVTAAVLALALDTIGAEKVALYDGSWTEWGGRDDAPVQTGPAR